jgi:hypothetical protein
LEVVSVSIGSCQHLTRRLWACVADNPCLVHGRSFCRKRARREPPAANMHRTSDHCNPRTMFCVVSHAANIVSALVILVPVLLSPINHIPFPSLSLFLDYFPSHCLSKSFKYFTYYRHGFAVGSSALGGISTSSNYLYVLEQSTCVAANSIATRIACYSTTR